MTRSLTLFFLISASLLNACNNSQTFEKNKPQESATSSDSVLTVDKLNNDVLIHLLKDAILDSFGNAVWNPMGDEKNEFPISDDNKCHTSLDTILYFTGTDSIKNAVIILRTYQFDHQHIKYGNHYEGSPVGVALFKQNNEKKWELFKISKKITSLGYYVGAEPKYKGFISLKNISPNYTCLYFKQNLGGQQGYVEGFESLYLLDDSSSEREIFSQLYFNDYSLTHLKLLN
jgi:hypothetical protein